MLKEISTGAVRMCKPALSAATAGRVLVVVLDAFEVELVTVVVTVWLALLGSLGSPVAFPTVTTGSALTIALAVDFVSVGCGCPDATTGATAVELVVVTVVGVNVLVGTPVALYFTEITSTCATVVVMVLLF